MIRHINPPPVRPAWACTAFVLILAVVGAVPGAGVAARADMRVSLNLTAFAFDQALPPRESPDQDFGGGAFGHGISTSYTASATAVADAGRASASATATVRHTVESDGLAGKLDYTSSTQGIPYDFFSPFGSSSGSFGSFDFTKTAPRAGTFQIAWNATPSLLPAAITWTALGEGPGRYEMQLTGAGQPIVFEGGFQSLGTNGSAAFSLVSSGGSIAWPAPHRRPHARPESTSRSTSRADRPGA